MPAESLEKFFVQAWLSYKAFFGFIEIKTYMLYKILNPILQLIFFCMLAKYIYRVSDLTPWVIGNSFLLCIYNTVFGIGSGYNSDRSYGTLKIVISSPGNHFMSYLHRSIIHIFDSMITVSLGMIVGFILFGAELSNASIAELILITGIAVTSASGLGLFIGSIGLLTSEMNLIMNLFSMTLIACSGANFSIELLPELLQKVSNCLPITRSIEAARILIIEGSELRNVFYLLFQEILIGSVYAFLGYISLRLTEKIAIVKGTLELF